MASSNPPEPVDTTQQRRARRRLIGAIALVLIAVIALPWIFDPEKKALDQDMSVVIPSQDVVTVRKPASAGSNPKIVDPKEPGVVAAPKGDAAAQKVDTPATAKDNAAAPARDVPARENQKSESRIEARPDAKAEAKVESRAAPKSESKGAKADAAPAPAGEEARVKAILDGKAAAAAGTTGGFAVQIGAFASDDKVREARDKLAVAGYKSYVEKLDTKEGERTRVRAGPFPGRDSAEAARDKIRTLGFDGAAVVAR